MPDGWSCDGILSLAAAAAEPDADIPNALRLVGADYATDVPASKVSKGMKRRLALAIALIRPIKMLILDEPESGLDPGQRHRLRRRIERLRRTMTILVASHDLGELGLMSDRVLSSTKGAASSSSNRAVGSRGIPSNTSSSHWKEPYQPIQTLAS